jgi:hypothetical protein
MKLRAPRPKLETKSAPGRELRVYQPSYRMIMEVTQA